MQNQQPAHIPIRELRRKLKALLASTQPIIVTTHNRTTAILIPLQHHGWWEKAEKRRALARAKRHFRAAIQDVAASYW
jgi:prevent-host-death family protein